MPSMKRGYSKVFGSRSCFCLRYLNQEVRISKHLKTDTEL